jgi:class 3 adenylate cyclase
MLTHIGQKSFCIEISMRVEKLFTLILLNLFILFPVFSNDTFYYTNIESVIKIDNGVQVFRDSKHQLQIADFISGSIPMAENADGVLNFENTADHIWLKFAVKNTTSESIFLQFGNSELENVTCYVLENGKLVSIQQSGSKHPYHTRYLNSNKISLPLGSHNPTVFIKINSGSVMYMPLLLGSLKSLSGINHKEDLFNGSMIGIMLVLIFYNFFLFLAIRDRLYLKYCLYLFCSTAMMFFLEGLHFDLLWRNHHGFNNSHLVKIIIAGTAASGIWFSYSFLNMRINAPKLKWVNLFLILALTSSVILDILHIKILANKLLQTSSGITSFYLLITGIVMFYKGLKEAKFYILSWGVLVSGALVYVFTLNGLIEINFITINSFQIASVSEGVLLSFALADRINTYIREKHIAQNMAIAEAQKNERLIMEQNVELERKVEERTADLKAEKKKSDDLLLNILPSEIAEELKAKGESEARQFEIVSVLFTDFVNFTGIGETLSPTELVKEINVCFKAFDEIIGRTGLEKIKTIGDAYMAVCGMPVEDKEHAQKVTRAAFEICNFIEQYHKEGGSFEIRIGINSGPVVAGIVGLKKFAYDIWGDTVNTAARMEQNSEKGKINISSATYELIKKEFKCKYRGKINAKNKGEIEMYFVEGEY